MAAFIGKCRALISEEEMCKGKLGNWMAIKLKHHNKTLIVITTHRLPSSSSNGPTCSLTQCNLVDGKAKTTTEHRKEIFYQIKMHLQGLDEVSDVIIAGDFNQNIASNEVQSFFRDIGAQDAHSIYNNVQLNQMDKTYIRSSSPIDSVALSSGIMDYVEGVKLLSQNEIVMSDHRSYAIDINLEEYFEDQFSLWNPHNRTILNSSRQSHRTMFYEELERQLNIYNVEA